MKNLLNRTTELAHDPRFIKVAAKTCKDLGVTAEEWNKNKGALLFKLASKAVLMDLDKQK